MPSSAYPPHPSLPHAAQEQMPAASPPAGSVVFGAFGAQAFEEAHRRHVPVFLIIGDVPPEFADPSLCAQIAERTVPVQLMPGMRTDVELLCQRAGVLFSEEGALPLCALMQSDALPFLAAPLPPAGFSLDPSRMLVWLTQADRRFVQNQPAFSAQASEVVRSFRAQPLPRPYAPADAAHDLMRAILSIEDKKSGGFGRIKAPFATGLRFLHHAALHGGHQAHAALSRALDAMLASALYDPLDGGFFRATLTDDWRVFVPEKPLGVNAMLALTLLESGRRQEAVRTLDFIVDSFPIQGGGLSPFVRAAREIYAFTPEQACAALGSEDGLRACRLLGLLRQQVRRPPAVTPSRFSPVDEEKTRPSLDDETPSLCPQLSSPLTPEDAAFLRRVYPALLRARNARAPQLPPSYIITEDCALAACVLALCGQRLGEPRYIQAAQRAVSFLISLAPVQGFPPAFAPVSPLLAHASCGGAAALSLALLTLGRGEGMGEYAASGLRLLSAALHAFVREDGLPMFTMPDSAAFFPRVPAIYDSELPSPAALVVHALRLAEELRPDAHFGEGIEAIWQAAAPGVHAQPIACAGLIDAMMH